MKRKMSLCPLQFGASHFSIILIFNSKCISLACIEGELFFEDKTTLIEQMSPSFFLFHSTISLCWFLHCRHSLLLSSHEPNFTITNCLAPPYDHPQMPLFNYPQRSNIYSLISPPLSLSLYKDGGSIGPRWTAVAPSQV